MSTLKVSTVKSLTASTPPSFQDTNGVEVGQLCRAWVRFNTVTSTTITDSYNVSSLTDNGTGDTTVNFTVAMPTANYAVAGSGSGTSTLGIVLAVSTTTAPTTSAVRVITDRASAGVADVAYASVVIFGD